jgi:cell division protein FtsI (penicillin-binding protein 3)
MPQRRDDAGGDTPDGERRTARRTPRAPEVPPLQPRRPGAGGTGRGGISQARAYTPRGRTVREAAEAAGTGERPSRPALRLVAGGADIAAGDSVGARAGTSAKPGTSGTPAKPGTTARPGTRAKPVKPSTSAKPGMSQRTGIKTRDGGRSRPKARPNKAADRRKRALLGRFEANRRLRVGTVIMLLIFVTLGGRLVQLQLSDGKAYAAAGLKDRLTTTVLPAIRGSILDRNGAVLAVSEQARYIYADPTKVVNPETTATKLRDLLAIPVEQLLPLLEQKTQSDGRPNEFVYLARSLAIPTANAVMALNLPGIGMGNDQKRVAPGHDLAANVLGFVGTDQNGLAGLEYKDNSLLAGKAGSETYEIGDGNLITQLPGGYDQVTPARPGTSLQLTLDRDLQYQVQQDLYTHMTAARADFAAAVVMKVSTGEVLAQASYPSYDADNYQDYPDTAYKDAATQVTVDPGSSAKIITLGAALNTGVLAPDSTVRIGPSIYKGGVRYHDDTEFPTGTKITIPGILAYSSNVGTITVASKLTPDTIYRYQKLFGLGQASGEGVQNEAPGDLLPPSKWTSTSYGSIPIGEGLAATPLQMTAAYCAIANNGTYIQPHIVKATVAASGKVVPAAAPATHQVMAPQTAATLRTALEAVTSAQGATARRAAVKGYVIAGKTGTGQQVGPNGKYLPGYAISFIGMAPADHPQYVIGVFAHVPGGSGGLYAAPTFRDMMTYTLQHFQVPPSGNKPPKFVLTVK